MSQALMFRDASITSLSGSSQQALGPNGQRQLLIIENDGADNVGINLCGPNTGGTQTTTGIGNLAAIAGTGTITIVAGGSLVLDHVVPQNAVNVIGTSGQPLTVIEA